MKKKRVMQASVIVAILAIGFVGMNLLGSVEKKSNKRDIKPNVRPVETQEVIFSDLLLEINGNGVIESQKTLKMVSEASGRVLFAKNDLKSGTFVKKDELVLEIDPTEITNTLYSLRSDFLNTVASILPDMKVENEKSYEKWYEYFTTLKINENTPELPQISDSKEKIKVSTRNVFTKFYAVKNQEVLLSKHFIRAPFSGYIQSDGIIENSYISRGQTMFTLHDAVNLEIAVPLLVEEAEMINFAKQPKVKIMNDKDESKVVLGKVIRKENNLNRNSQTMNVYVELTNSSLDPFFLPGNYVDLKIEGRVYHDVATLQRNLVSDEGYAFTMVDNKLSRVKLDILAIDGDNVIFTNSIPKDTRFVKTILQKPLLGMQIESINENHEEVKTSSEESDEKI